MIEKLVLAILIVALLLTACKSDERQETPGGSPVPETAQAPQVEVERTTVLFAVDDWDMSRYDDLIRAFEEANPDLRVQLVSINEALELGPGVGRLPDDTWQRLASAADVIDFSTEWLDPGSAIRDLTPLMEADPTFQAEDFYPGVLESQQWDGGIWALPTIVHFDLIFFNKDAFDAAGLPYPEPGWTWDDFVAQARALTERQDDKVTRWGFAQPWPNHLEFIQGRVESLIDQSADPPLPRFDQPDVIEAVRWYTDLYLAEQVTPYLPSETPDQPPIAGQQLIESGKAAMWLDTSSGWHQANQGVAPFPVDAPDSHTSSFWAQGLSLSAGTAHPEAAWRWMDFLSRQRLEFLSSYLPSRRSTAEISGFWDEVDAEFAAALRYAIDHSYKSGRSVGYSELSDAIDAILAGEKSVENALAEAQAQAQDVLQKDAARQAQATPAPTVVVAPPATPEATVEGAVSITFVTGLAGQDLQPYHDAAQQFQKLRPDIIVEIKPYRFSSEGLDMQDWAAQADCFQGFADLQDPANLAAVLSLDPFLDANPSFDSDDFSPALLEQFSQQGQLWALPAEVDLYVIEYNKGLFDASGVDYPTPGWSADDFLTAAAALTQGEGENKQYGFVPQAYEAADLFMMLDRLGADLLDEREDPLALALNDSTTVEALNWYVNLSEVYGVKPVFITDLSETMDDTAAFMERDALIAEGRAAMWSNSTRMTALDAPHSFDVGVVTLPSRASGDEVGVWYLAIGYYISAHTQARQACWEWITFLTQAPEVALGLPARRSVAGSDAYRQLVGAERATAYLASITEMEQSSALQTISGSDEWLSVAVYWLGRALSQVLEGELSAEQALDAVQKLADDYRACVIARDALADRQEWQKCLQETDPALPDFLFQSGE